MFCGEHGWECEATPESARRLLMPKENAMAERAASLFALMALAVSVIGLASLKASISPFPPHQAT
jgi:hypothetical protein